MATFVMKERIVAVLSTNARARSNEGPASNALAEDVTGKVNDKHHDSQSRIATAPPDPCRVAVLVIANFALADFRTYPRSKIFADRQWQRPAAGGFQHVDNLLFDGVFILWWANQAHSR
jgi:hypothetical protein